MEKIPTILEFIQNNPTYNRAELATEFAKLHVQAALQTAAEKADIEVWLDYQGENGSSYIVDRQSILLAYPLENIR